METLSDPCTVCSPVSPRAWRPLATHVQFVLQFARVGIHPCSHIPTERRHRLVGGVIAVRSPLGAGWPILDDDAGSRLGLLQRATRVAGDAELVALVLEFEVPVEHLDSFPVAFIQQFGSPYDVDEEPPVVALEVDDEEVTDLRQQFLELSSSHDADAVLQEHDPERYSDPSMGTLQRDRLDVQPESSRRSPGKDVEVDGTAVLVFGGVFPSKLEDRMSYQLHDGASTTEFCFNEG